MASGPDPGLCGSCRHARVVVSGRGSRFHLCRRSRSDPRYPKYPRLPVLACPGWEEEGAGAAEGDDRHGMGPAGGGTEGGAGGGRGGR